MFASRVFPRRSAWIAGVNVRIALSLDRFLDGFGLELLGALHDLTTSSPRTRRMVLRVSLFRALSPPPPCYFRIRVIFKSQHLPSRVNIHIHTSKNPHSHPHSSIKNNFVASITNKSITTTHRVPLLVFCRHFTSHSHPCIPPSPFRLSGLYSIHFPYQGDIHSKYAWTTCP